MGVNCHTTAIPILEKIYLCFAELKMLKTTIYGAFTLKIIAAAFLLGLSIFVNFHVYNSSKNNLPPNKTIMKIATMSGRGLLVIVLIAAAIAFY